MVAAILSDARLKSFPCFLALIDASGAKTTLRMRMVHCLTSVPSPQKASRLYRGLTVPVKGVKPRHEYGARIPFSWKLKPR